MVSVFHLPRQGNNKCLYLTTKSLFCWAYKITSYIVTHSESHHTLTIILALLDTLTLHIAKFPQTNSPPTKTLNYTILLYL